MYQKVVYFTPTENGSLAVETNRLSNYCVKGFFIYGLDLKIKPHLARIFLTNYAQSAPIKLLYYFLIIAEKSVLPTLFIM